MFRRFIERRRLRQLTKRLTERVQELMALAQEEALHFNHNYIGTEHILLGVLRREEDPTAEILRGFGLTLERGREWIENTIGYGEEGRMVAQPPLSPRLKKAMEQALQESRDQGHDRVDTEHILLGVLRERVSAALRMLIDMKVDREAISRELVRRQDAGRPT